MKRADPHGASLGAGAVLRLLLGFLVLVVGLEAESGTSPLGVGGDPRVDPADFVITEFASGLDGPLPMQALSDGSLLVGTADGVRHLADADDDGVADDAGTLVFSGGGGLVTGLRVVGDLAFVSRDQTISVLRLGATPSAPLVPEASFVIQLPLPWSHISHTLAARPIGVGSVEVYFNMGSEADAVATAGVVSVTGDLTGDLVPDSIYRFVVDDSGPAVALVGLERVASGVRNAFGIDFHPESGDLYFQDNSMDGPTEPFELSVDELNRLPDGAIGGPIEDFGFPDNYFAYRTNLEVGSGAIDPEITFQPIPPPNGSEAEGAVEIAFAPPLFPPGLRDGVFVGFHGLFSSAGASNPDNPVVYVDLETGQYFHFVANTEAGIGHPDGLLATADALYIADFNSVDGFVTPGAGRIYKIRAQSTEVPVLGGPATLVLCGGLMLGAVRWLGATLIRVPRRR